ncbi:hypothetical protein COCVIDRAFT_31695 [Bipolaris victoriae FI3]|uniref:Uncharacterized protein n=1 Tax=Bipolaris victoriae (strain FI3) TaxID=930091 RepID=W7DYA2_BIPV3|nr:hypothetical protein COCVIDRAFT_31695 [Bipolaris victoriae FI3]
MGVAGTLKVVINVNRVSRAVAVQLGNYDHSGHATPAFDTYCKENKIITLYMPPYIFSLLNRVYGREIEELVH